MAKTTFLNLPLSEIEDVGDYLLIDHHDKQLRLADDGSVGEHDRLAGAVDHMEDADQPNLDEAAFD